jgi:hypothetical protein
MSRSDDVTFYLHYVHVLALLEPLMSHYVPTATIRSSQTDDVTLLALPTDVTLLACFRIAGTIDVTLLTNKHAQVASTM